eukprot:TRINITY_DN3098_c0_g1_i1.p1 TRINITY_DN3098_c0_g1~~TRINITY_DN3098_c0_g1_i1.p1  ORF type:complete len:334 (+),score=170.47 TRINITY_DN3098_c0_g1_i1:147-1148(+)
MAEKKKKEKGVNTAILQCAREVQVDELAKALLREYMHKRGFMETLRAFDAEDPRGEFTIGNRSLMMDMMFLKQKSASSIMEAICQRRLNKKASQGEVDAMDAEVAALEAELAEVTAAKKEKLKARKALEADIESLEKKAEEAEKKEKEAKKKEKKKKEDGGKGAKASKSGASGGWQPPGAAQAVADPLAAAESLSIGVGYKASSSRGQIGFGGREWKPPAFKDDGESSAMWPSSSAITGASELNDLREKMRLEVERERERFDSTLHKTTQAAQAAQDKPKPTEVPRPEHVAFSMAASVTMEDRDPVPSALKDTATPRDRDGMRKVSFAEPAEV